MHKIFVLIKILTSLYHNGKGVRANYHKPIITQLREIIALRSSGFRISPTEYYEFRLFSDDKTLQEKKQYVGWRFKEQTSRFCDSRWSLPLRDKVLQQLYLEHLDLPYPKIQAVCGPYQRYIGETPSFAPDDKFIEFLRNDINYPVFSKPLAASMGRDGISIQNFDSETNSLLLGNGKKLAITDYLKQLQEEDRGTVLQEQVIPHPKTVEFFGNRLASVRILTLAFKNRTKVVHVSLRIPTGINMTDNFSQGIKGNMVAQINLETGTIEKVLKGVGMRQKYIDKHPDTGKLLCGFEIPNWKQMLDITLLATSAIPGLYIQNWDVAIGNNGPVLLEMNFPGDVEHMQHAHGKGIYNDDFKEMLQEWGIS